MAIGAWVQRTEKRGEEKRTNGVENRKRGEENRKKGEENRKRGEENRNCTLGATVPFVNITVTGLFTTWPGGSQ